MQQQTENHLKEIYESMKEDSDVAELKNMPEELKNGINRFDTTVPLDTLKALNEDLYHRPEDMNVKKLNRVLKRREKMLDDGNTIDWGAGEALAFSHDVLKHRSEEHTSELQSRYDLVCRILLEKKQQNGT